MALVCGGQVERHRRQQGGHQKATKVVQAQDTGARTREAEIGRGENWVRGLEM